MNGHTADVIIAGAGFAGLECAKRTASAGLRTVVYERKPWPGTRVHTTGIIVKELAEQWNIPCRLYKNIAKVRLYSPGLDYLDLSSPDYYFLATDTPALLKWHGRQAVAAGARIQFSSAVTALRAGSRGYRINHVGRCRYLVGCDGARSTVARLAGLGINKRFIYGIEAESDSNLGVEDDMLHVFIDPEIARGYIAWIVPGVQCWQVGLACTYPVKPVLECFFHRIRPLTGDIRIDMKGIRAGLIPCNGPVTPFYKNRLLLLGDAAGMVSPLTAGGIHPAIQSARLAGDLIADYIRDGGPSPGPLVKRCMPRYLYKRFLRTLVDISPLPARSIDYMLASVPFRLLAQSIFFHNRGVFTAAAWRDFVRLLYQH